MLVWPSQVEKFHSIDVKSMKSLGKGNGFRYTDSEDQGLVDLVKAKIKSLYERFSLNNKPSFIYGRKPSHLFIGLGKPIAKTKGGLEI